MIQIHPQTPRAVRSEEAPETPRPSAVTEASGSGLGSGRSSSLALSSPAKRRQMPPAGSSPVQPGKVPEKARLPFQISRFEPVCRSLRVRSNTGPSFRSPLSTFLKNAAPKQTQRGRSSSLFSNYRLEVLATLIQTDLKHSDIVYKY